MTLWDASDSEFRIAFIWNSAFGIWHLAFGFWLLAFGHSSPTADSVPLIFLNVSAIFLEPKKIPNPAEAAAFSECYPQFSAFVIEACLAG